jgi:hypothetical protein
MNYVLFVDIIGDLLSNLSLRSSLSMGASMMDPKVSPTQPPVASSSHQQHSSEHSTAATHPRLIDLKALHSSFGHTSHTLEKRGQPQQVRIPLGRSPNLSESDKELVLALGLEEVYKRMAENHKFHIDVVQKVVAGLQSLEHADSVLCSMHKAAEHEYVRKMKEDFGVTIQGGMYQKEESSEEEPEEEDAA